MKNPSYDTIGEHYKNYIETAPVRAIETRMILHMAGKVSGLRVLDLACGFGSYGRELLRRGASYAVGVDISEKMIHLAKKESLKNEDSMQFHVRDICDMETLGQFDLIVAAWLFNYAESLTHLLKMFKVVSKNLKPSGRLIACTVNPEFQLAKGICSDYGVKVLSQEAKEEGFQNYAEFMSTPPSPFTFYQWNKDTYEQAIYEAGLSQIEWEKPTPSDSDIQKYEIGFWNNFKENPLMIGFTCIK